MRFFQWPDKLSDTIHHLMSESKQLYRKKNGASSFDIFQRINYLLSSPVFHCTVNPLGAECKYLFYCIFASNGKSHTITCINVPVQQSYSSFFFYINNKHGICTMVNFLPSVFTWIWIMLRCPVGVLLFTFNLLMVAIFIIWTLSLKRRLLRKM